MTSAGLYRHYEDKEAMFNAMVEPLIVSIKEWTGKHTSKKYDLLLYMIMWKITKRNSWKR